MRRILKFTAMGMLGVVLLLAFLLIDLTPSVGKNAHQQVENAENVSTLISQLRNSFRNRYQPQQIDISYSQAESLLGFTQRALPAISSDLKLSDDNAEILISYQLPAYLPSSYFNISIKVNEGPNVNIDSVSLGMVTIPGDWVLSWAESLANSYTNSEVATKAIEQIAKTEISSNQIRVSLKPLDPFLRELKNIKTSEESNDRQLLRIKTAHYLRLLESLPAPYVSSTKSKDTSLSYYLHCVMKEAKAMSAPDGSNSSNSATLENEAAIMALAIYAGHRRFSTLFGDLSFAVDPIPAARTKPSLAGREDLSLHFIFSAAIKLLSEQGISIAVGEFKELMDRGQGGSGYSFVDLAADMAGANFAALAVDPITAEQVQDILSMEANETLFFPGIDGFDEGMDKAQFRKRYTNIESPQYSAVVDEIERRLSRLPIGKDAK